MPPRDPPRGRGRVRPAAHGMYRGHTLRGCARAGVKNGWAGIVIYGCVRDAAEIGAMPLGVRCPLHVPLEMPVLVTDSAMTSWR